MMKTEASQKQGRRAAQPPNMYSSRHGVEAGEHVGGTGSLTSGVVTDKTAHAPQQACEIGIDNSPEGRQGGKARQTETEGKRDRQTDKRRHRQSKPHTHTHTHTHTPVQRTVYLQLRRVARYSSKRCEDQRSCGFG